MKYIGVEKSIPPEIWRIARAMRAKVMLEGHGSSEGKCGWASMMIVKKLKCIGYKKARVRYGSFITHKEKRYYWSHAWVEVDGLILDVTADQFNNSTYNMEKHDNVSARAIVFATYAGCQGRYINGSNRW